MNTVSSLELLLPPNTVVVVMAFFARPLAFLRYTSDEYLNTHFVYMWRNSKQARKKGERDRERNEVKD